jgi:hypothetical protein
LLSYCSSESKIAISPVKEGVTLKGGKDWSNLKPLEFSCPLP